MSCTHKCNDEEKYIKYEEKKKNRNPKCSQTKLLPGYVIKFRLAFYIPSIYCLLYWDQIIRCVLCKPTKRTLFEFFVFEFSSFVGGRDIGRAWRKIIIS